MFHLRSYIIVFLLSGSLSAFSQSHDFEIKGFRENVRDLTAATSDMVDLRGRKPALIRFAVRDTLFSFRANLGIMDLKKDVGEILLFVPEDTKRITITHPYLGTLRDYDLPLSIKTRTTYDAEIVITNADYMRRLFGYDEMGVPKKESAYNPTEKPVSTEQPVLNEEPPINDVSSYTHKNHTPIQTHFLLGGGYQPLGVAGPTAMIGVEIGSFLFSADYTFGLEKVEGISVYYGDALGEAYDYSVSRFSLRMGINTASKSAFQVVPQVGASFNMIKGDELIKKSASTTQFSKSTPLSLSVALSFRVKLAKPLYLYATPQYDFAIGADDVYKVIKEADKKIKGWAEGFSVSAGLLLRF